MNIANFASLFIAASCLIIKDLSDLKNSQSFNIETEGNTFLYRLGVRQGPAADYEENQN